MRQPIIACGNCGRRMQHRAHGLCSTCYNHRWRAENTERYIVYLEQYEDGRREQRKKRRSTPAEKAKRNAYDRHHRRSSPAAILAREARHRTRLRNVPTTLTAEQARQLLGIGQATYPGEDLHLDHIVPVSAGGGTTHANMHAIPARLNQSKHSRLPRDAYTQAALP